MGRVKARRGRRHPIQHPKLKVVVLSGPATSGSNVSLARDVQLAKAAVLYSDEVELVSPGAEMIGSLLQLAAAGPDALIDLLSAFDRKTLAYLNRQNYSFPPDHGARVVTTILNDPELRADWQKELEETRLGMLALRQQLAAEAGA